MSIHLAVRTYPGRDRHVHDFSQILVPLQGAMRLDIEGRTDVVAGGSIAVIPQHHAHDFAPSADCSMLVLDVETAALPRGGTPALLCGEALSVTRVEPWLWRMFRLLGAEVEADASRASDAARLAMTGLHLIDPGSAPAPRPRSRVERRILEAADETATAVADMARRAGFGQSRFHALFKLTHGHSPKQLHLLKLFDRAVDRLIASSDPVSEIAYGLGYQNVSSFNRQFKRRFGVTPSEFRAAGRAEHRG
ncbi:helix-turn-helix domain-containing protein [Phreatobacter sp. AB_2022a]|uniref:helix-turn-helix domain-containing protein n=1 Tax=Phreatobacter sp. AB_2022a TaxID=3003134 RepID=UPI002287262D|nr:AraC family transcriptional regulator [Phreatobacter sp. AB_2022a]MCZ0734878.1 AraC family transcriptional regulator [Phreatobacter sp. AB_2022a]